MKFSDACKKVAEGISIEEVQRGKFKREDKLLLQHTLMVENKMFKIYLKTGKCTISTFPFNELIGNMALSNVEMIKVAKAILSNGWTPFVHARNTRKRYEHVKDYMM